MKHFSTITLATLLVFILAIFPYGCHKRTTPPIKKADVEMIGSGGLEPTDTSSTKEPDTGSFSLGETEEEEPATPQPQIRETEPTVSRRTSPGTTTTRSTFDPGRSIFRTVSQDISEDIAKEQEDFFLKNALATRGHYEAADGELLIPETSLQKMENMISSRFPVQLKTSCEDVTITVPSGSGEPIPAVVDILGEKVQARAKTSPESNSSYVDAELIYMYTVNAGEGSSENASWTVARTTRYRPNSEGRWRKTKVEERVISEVLPKPAAKPGTTTRKSSTKTKTSSGTTTGKTKQSKPPVKKKTVVDEPKAAAPVPPITDQLPAPQPSPAIPPASPPPAPPSPPKPTEAPVKPTEAPAKPPAAPPVDTSPPTSGGVEFDEMLIPDAPSQ